MVTNVTGGGFGDKQHVNMLLELFRHKYSNPIPDLIIPVLDSSLDLILNFGDKIFPGVPIVFGGSTSNDDLKDHFELAWQAAKKSRESRR